MSGTRNSRTEKTPSPPRRRWLWVVAILLALLPAHLLTVHDRRQADTLLLERISDAGGIIAVDTNKHQYPNSLRYYFIIDDDVTQLTLPRISRELFREVIARFTNLGSLTIDLSNCADLDRDAASQFTKLGSLTLTAGEEPEQRNYSFLADFPQVGGLELKGPFHDDGFWQYLPEMKSLTVLTVSAGPDVRGAGIPDLSESRLQYLTISASIPEEGQFGLRSLLTAPHLQEMAIHGKIDETDVQSLSVPSPVTTLRLTGTQVTDRILPLLAQCTSLQHLSLDNNQITGEPLDLLASLPLKNLYLSDNPLTADACRDLSQFPHLERLNLNRTGIKPRWLDCWADSPLSRSLRHLELSGNDVGQDAIKALGTFSLQGLSLNEVPLTEDTCRQLGELADLSGLNLADGGLQTEWIKSWEHSPLAASLRYLQLSRNEIGDDALEVLWSFPVLESLYLDGTKFSEEALFKFSDHPTLQYLTVDQSISDETIIQFQIKVNERSTDIRISRSE